MDVVQVMPIRRIVLLILAIFALNSAPVLRLQAQIDSTLFDGITGTLAAGETTTYSFNAQSGMVLSFDVAADEGLDALVAVTDSSGRLVAQSDDRAYPDDLVPLLEAITLPRTDTYSVTISSVAGTSGDYSIFLRPGYAQLSSVGFGDGRWRTAQEGVSVDATAERVIMNAEGVRLLGFAYDNAFSPVADFFAQVDVITISSQTGNWGAGLSFRADDEAQYLFTVNQAGAWRFSFVENGAEQVIRDWTPHPALVAGETTFTLGVLAHDDSFDFFYNNTFIGANTDDSRTDAGRIGVMTAAPTSLNTLNIATFANLLITTPINTAETQYIPEQILITNDGRALVTSLRRLLPIGADGDMGMTIPQSSIQYNRAGVNVMRMGRGVRYQNFVLGVRVALNAGAADSAGCGIAADIVGDDDYLLVYFNGGGEYGISRRTGDTFAPGLVGTSESFVSEGEAHLLIVASGNTLYFYIDGAFVGSQESTMDEGELGIAAVNFEPNATTCTFNDLWLWSWTP